MTESTKVSIVLAKPSDWWIWFKQIKDIAKNRDIWEYVDPDGSISEPTRPQAPKTTDIGADDLPTIFEQRKIDLWREMQRDYELNTRSYDKIRKHLIAIRTAIYESIPSVIQLGLDSDHSVRQNIQSLRTQFKPSAQARVMELNQRFQQLTTPTRNKGVDKWFADWREFITEAKNCPEYSLNGLALLIPFYDAVRPLMPIFTEYRQQMTLQEESKAIDISKEVYLFEQRYNQDKSTSRQHSAFATFQGRQEGNGQSNSSKPRQNNQPTCLCGAQHRFRQCAYVNPTLRPPGWTPDLTIQARFDSPKPERTQRALDFARADPNDLQRQPNQPQAPAPRPVQSANVQRTAMATRCTAMAVPSSKSALRDCWIADTGSDTHICNNLARFLTLEPCTDGSTLEFGNQSTPILGFGSVEVYGTNQGNPSILELSNVAYVPSLHTNIVSMVVASKVGVYFSGRRPCLKNRFKEPICDIHQLLSQNIIEYNPLPDLKMDLPSTSFSIKRSYQEPHSTADAELWHARLAHASTAAVDHLTASAEGVSLPPCKHKNISDSCEICKLSKAQRQISRRPVPPANKPWEKVYFDFFSVTPTGFNGDRYCLHFVCSCTGWQIAINMPNKDQIRFIRAIKGLVYWAKTQLNATIKCFFSDNDRSLGLAYSLFAEDEGIRTLFSSRYADSQHGKPERSGGVILTKARSMMLQARLPEALWPVAIQTAVYLINRTPVWTKGTDANDKNTHFWTTPYEQMLGSKPNLANLRVFGCRTYVRDAKVPKGQKMASRAWIGYLVGYTASNIWQIWNPRRQEVIEERDVTFNESLFYDPDLPLPQEIPTTLPPPLIQTLKLPPIIKEADQEADLYSDDYEPPSQSSNLSFSSAPFTNSTLELSGTAPKSSTELLPLLTPEQTPRQGHPGGAYTRPIMEPTTTSSSSSHMPGSFADSPPISPNHSMEPFFIPSPGDKITTSTTSTDSTDSTAHQLSTELDESSSRFSTPSGGDHPSPAPIHRNTAQRSNEISSDLDPNLIITGRRTRRQPHHAFSACQGFSLGLAKPASHSSDSAPASESAPIKQIHRNELPPEPMNYREVAKHPLSHLFIDAMDIELQSLEAKGTWKAEKRPANIFIIPSIWVYKYKFGDDGFLKKVKARLCVQGNKQVLSHSDTRAATLAARCFRTLMALVAAFGLEMKQYDAINAFVNSFLDEVVYIEPPPGYPLSGHALRLVRALYGLRRSPRLWQMELTKTLCQIGLEPVNEEPCLFTSKGIILMVYVDDILLIHHPDHLDEANQVAASLEAHYELRYEGEGDVFLGVKIVRDRPNQSIHLSNTDYIQKIVSRFHMEHLQAPTPYAHEKPLLPHDSQADPDDIHHYQQKIGSINYAAIATRPDIAKCSSHLATFMLNPGPHHFDAVNRVIAYLNYTQKVGIQYSAHAITSSTASDCFMTASDAALGDHPDRHSSEGYLATLYGGPVDWKASKQHTVTTSSTEAEFLAISEAGKTLQWWRRLFASIGFDPEHHLSIKCDNMQTIRILCKDDPTIQTKLRHVDIHQHWLRQETQSKRILIDWIPTSLMPADGLTKTLTGQRFHNFVRLLGLTEFA